MKQKIVFYRHKNYVLATALCLYIKLLISLYFFQEQISKLEMGSMPKSMLVTLEDDLVDSCKPGDDVFIW